MERKFFPPFFLTRVLFFFQRDEFEGLPFAEFFPGILEATGFCFLSGVFQFAVDWGGRGFLQKKRLSTFLRFTFVRGGILIKTAGCFPLVRISCLLFCFVFLMAGSLFTFLSLRGVFLSPWSSDSTHWWPMVLTVADD